MLSKRRGLALLPSSVELMNVYLTVQSNLTLAREKIWKDSEQPPAHAHNKHEMSLTVPKGQELHPSKD